MTYLTRLSLRNRAVVALLSIILAAFGVVAMTSLKQELYPSLQIPTAAVVSAYPGASPESIERDISIPLENAVKGVPGVTKVTSASLSGLSQVTVEWDFDRDADKVRADLDSAIAGVRGTLPENVDPKLSTGNIDDFPVLVIGVASGLPQPQLGARLEDVAVPKLRGIDGVRDVSVAGIRKNQVVVRLRPADLERYGVNQATLPQVFQANGVAVPAGTMKAKSSDLDVQVGTTLTTAKQVAAIQIPGSSAPVRLDRIATVSEQLEPPTSYSRTNGEPTLTLSVIKDQDANTVHLSHAVRDELPGLAETIGEETTFTTVFDQAPFIETSIHDLTVEGTLGLIFAVLVIFAFLWSLRPTLISAISIPASLLIAFIGLWRGGETLNILTLSALTVAIGRVIDDSIVVIENIQRHQAGGEEGASAIIPAVREVAGAVTSSTLTTVAVFLPLGLVTGEAGQLFRPFALTVTIALLASLLVSLTIVPVLASWFMRRTARHGGHASAGGEGADEVEDHERETRLQRSYLPALHWALGHRVITLLLAAIVFLGTMALVPKLKTDFLGDAGQAYLRVTQKTPPGSSLAATDLAAKKLETIIFADDAVETISSTVGNEGGGVFFGISGGDTATMQVALKEGTRADELAGRLRPKLAEVQGLGQVDFSSGEAGGGQALVAVNLVGDDPAVLATAAGQVVEMMHGIPDLAQVRSDLTSSKAQLRVTVDTAKAATYGMTQADVGQAVNQAVQGVTIGTLERATGAVDIVVRTAQAPTTAAALRAIPLPVTQKQTVDAQKRASEQVQDQQQAMQDQQLSDAQAAAAAQVESLRSARTAAQDQVAKLQEQIAALEASLADPNPTPVDPRTAAQQQLTTLRSSLTAARDQVTQLDGQITQANEQQTQATQRAAEAARLADAAKKAAEAKGTAVTLGDVATVKSERSPQRISRLDGQRAAVITATPVGGNLSATTSALSEGLSRLSLPDGVTATIGGVSQQQEESFRQLGLAMLAAIAVVFLIMVGTFRSLVQPLILLVSIPFAATGAVAALLLTGTALGIPAMVGLLMLIGIVVTNAIVLIDLINQKRERGVPLRPAIVDGARLRLRPIIMTALATIFALLPMGLGLTGGGVFISKPLAVVVIGGLLTSTLLTLILVPVLYDMVEVRGERRRTGVTAPRTKRLATVGGRRRFSVLSGLGERLRKLERTRQERKDRADRDDYWRLD